MIICKNCGTKLNNNVNFCGECGYVLEKVSQPKEIYSQPQQQNNIQPTYQQPQQTYQQPAYQQQQPVYRPTYSSISGKSTKSTITAFLLCLFLGAWGIHRFYVGKAGTGLLWLFTSGILGIGIWVDLFMIAFGNFKDSDGYPLESSTGAKIFLFIYLGIGIIGLLATIVFYAVLLSEANNYIY